MLGVCRGMQVMAVARGRHARSSTCPTWSGTTSTARAGDAYGDGRGPHRPRSSRLRRARRRARLTCAATTTSRCATHPGFAPVAWAADGTLEAMEAPAPAFLLAVQWHPEVVTDAGLFGALVGAAGRGDPA